MEWVSNAPLLPPPPPHIGEEASRLPTLILEAGPSRGLADLSGVLSALASPSSSVGGVGVGVCAFDKPGLGFSDPMRVGQLVRAGGAASYYGGLLARLSAAEEGRFGAQFILVG